MVHLRGSGAAARAGADWSGRGPSHPGPRRGSVTTVTHARSSVKGLRADLEDLWPGVLGGHAWSAGSSSRTARKVAKRRGRRAEPTGPPGRRRRGRTVARTRSPSGVRRTMVARRSSGSGVRHTQPRSASSRRRWLMACLEIHAPLASAIGRLPSSAIGSRMRAWEPRSATRSAGTRGRRSSPPARCGALEGGEEVGPVLRGGIVNHVDECGQPCLPSDHGPHGRRAGGRGGPDRDGVRGAGGHVGAGPSAHPPANMTTQALARLRGTWRTARPGRSSSRCSNRRRPHRRGSRSRRRSTSRCWRTSTGRTSPGPTGAGWATPCRTGSACRRCWPSTRRRRRHPLPGGRGRPRWVGRRPRPARARMLGRLAGRWSEDEAARAFSAPRRPMGRLFFGKITHFDLVLMADERSGRHPRSPPSSTTTTATTWTVWPGPCRRCSRSTTALPHGMAHGDAAPDNLLEPGEAPWWPSTGASPRWPPGQRPGAGGGRAGGRVRPHRGGVAGADRHRGRRLRGRPGRRGRHRRGRRRGAGPGCRHGHPLRVLGPGGRPERARRGPIWPGCCAAGRCWPGSGWTWPWPPHPRLDGIGRERAVRSARSERSPTLTPR